jgi:Tfp pilus assembly protein PilN
MLPFDDIATGIEFTGTSVRFVQLRKRFRRISLANYGEKEIPVESIEYSSSKDKVILETARGLLAEKKARVRDVAVSLPRSAAFFRRLTLPPVDDEMIPSMVENMVERHLPVRPAQAVYDFDSYEPDRKGAREVILVGAKRDDVMEQLNLLKKMGVSPALLEPSSMSTARLVSEIVEAGEGEFIQVFLGERSVHLNLFRGKRLLTSRSVRMGLEDVRHDPDAAADGIQREILETGAALDMIPGGDILSAKIILSCPPDLADVMKKALAERLGTEVLTHAIPSWIQEAHGLDPAKYGTALGLAAGLLRSSSPVVNLLPQEMKEKKRKDQVAKIWLLAGLNALLVVGLFASISIKRARELSAIRDEIASLEQAVKEAEGVKGEYLDAVNAEKAISEMESQRIDWLALLNDISTILPDDAWLTRVEFEKDKPILLAGMASSAAKLIPILENSPLLEDVKFEAPTTTTSMAGKQVESFRITATVKQGAQASETDEAR